MNATITKIRQLGSSLTDGFEKRVCPNCYFIILESSLRAGHNTCPCCEFLIENTFMANSAALATEDNLKSLV